MNHVIFYENRDKEIYINIVIDLDETIIHCIQTDDETYYNELIEMENCVLTFVSGDKNHVIFIRPYLFNFLSNLMNKYNIYISTYAHEDYAKCIINYIICVMPNLKICGIHYRVANEITFRDTKTLKVFELSEHNTIIIDDRYEVWDILYHNNIINIKKYLGPHDMMNVNDNHLVLIEKYINNIYEKYIVKNINVNAISEYNMYYNTLFDHNFFINSKTKMIDLDLLNINEIEDELNNKSENMFFHIK